MVMVGHSERLATPLSRRQSRTMAFVIAALIVLVAAAIAIASLSGSETRSARGCVDVVVPSTMGAGQLHQCGAAARQWCASLAGQTTPEARLVLPACRRAGFTTAGRVRAP